MKFFSSFKYELGSEFYDSIKLNSSRKKINEQQQIQSIKFVYEEWI